MKDLKAMNQTARVITYCLKPGVPHSDEYHRTIVDFADSWLAAATTDLQALIDGFRKHRLEQGMLDRSNAEYALELLALAVLLREHGREAVHMRGWVGNWMSRLVDIQNQYPRWEKQVKTLRGWLGWMARRFPSRAGDVDQIEPLLAWLAADGEMIKHERFQEWSAWFQSHGREFTRAAVSQCIQIADEFAKNSLDTLGKYTENVERFLAEEAPEYRFRYDARLVTRTRLEYHLGMLGTEILNRAYRERFLATKHKMVILPPCMCAPGEVCKAVETPFGAKCQACTPNCRVHQITKLGEKLGFGVTMIPDDMKVFGSGNSTNTTGLLGVSCTLTNWNGGWDAGAIGIPCQGLLLDYVGCKYHWDKNGIPTDTNLKKLREILGV
jgi:uncharacterized protein